MKIHGGCHCGKVSFTAEIDPARVSICHCTDCQHLSGSPFRASVPAPIGQFTLQGATRTYVKTAENGNRRAQVFCPECGTALYATDPVKPEVMMLRLGAIAERRELAPARQIWRKSALPWVDHIGELPAIAGQP